MAAPAVNEEEACGVRDVLDRLGDKWSVVVVYQLGRRSQRFTELKRSVLGVSQRMLTATLRGLECDGLVLRTVHPVVPPRVDYELTPLGRTFLDQAWTVMSWALENAEEVHKARRSYDEGR